MLPSYNNQVTIPLTLPINHISQCMAPCRLLSIHCYFYSLSLIHYLSDENQYSHLLFSISPSFINRFPQTENTRDRQISKNSFPMFSEHHRHFNSSGVVKLFIASLVQINLWEPIMFPKSDILPYKYFFCYLFRRYTIRG